MRKPYTRKKENPQIKAQELLRIEDHGITNTEYRKVYRNIDNNWHLVGLGCNKCGRSYQSLMPAVHHITKCNHSAINSLTEENEDAST